MLSANKLYKESGTTLSFKDWLEREKSKGKFIPNVEAIEEFHNADGSTDAETSTEPVKTAAEVESKQMITQVVRVTLILTLAYFIYRTINKNDFK
jgi:hypothetical protein